MDGETFTTHQMLQIVRERIVSALKAGDPLSSDDRLDAIGRFLQSEEGKVRIPELIAFVVEGDSDTRTAAIFALGFIRSDTVYAVMQAALEDTCAGVVAIATCYMAASYPLKFREQVEKDEIVLTMPGINALYERGLATVSFELFPAKVTKPAKSLQSGLLKGRGNDAIH